MSMNIIFMMIIMMIIIVLVTHAIDNKLKQQLVAVAWAKFLNTGRDVC